MKLREYLEISNLNPELFDSLIDYKIEVISIYEDKDPDELYDEDIKSLLPKYDRIIRELQNYHKPVKLINVEGNNLHLKPFTQLSLGEWIDLDYYLTNNMLVEALVVFYRKKESNGFDEDKWEKYGSFIENRKIFFLDIPYKSIIGVLKDFKEWREHFILSNRDLFNVEQEEEDLSSLSKEQIAEIRQIEKLEENKRKFAWEKLVMDLCNGDITKFNDVLNLPLIMVFNILSMQKITG